MGAAVFRLLTKLLMRALRGIRLLHAGEPGPFHRHLADSFPLIYLIGWFLLLFVVRGAASSDLLVFEEISPEASRIYWTHENAHSEKRYLPETMGPGAAFLDFNQNGWMDLYMVNSGPTDFYSPERPLRNALYRNNGDGTFTDVTIEAGVEGGTFGMGVAVGDYDGNGYPDLFITSYGQTILYRNNGDGTFDDVTREAGVFIEGWTTSAVWFDYDNDGHLDLFVGNYLRYEEGFELTCVEPQTALHYYCTPTRFDPAVSFLYRNNGDGTFTETGHNTAIGDNPGKTLGVVATDVNRDGWMDLFVANDTHPNFLFINRGQGGFEEVGLFAGVAYSSDGKARSGMGVDSADYDRDGAVDLFVDNIDHERYALYHNDGTEMFSDVTLKSDLGTSSWLMSGWGVKFLDFNNDGKLGLLVVNGHPNDRVSSLSADVTFRQPLLLFQQIEGRFRDVSASAGPVFQRRLASRGLTLGDYNNDGAIDALVTVNGGRPLLLKNRTGRQNHWLGLRLIAKTTNPSAVGAWIRWNTKSASYERLKVGGGSYLSDHDPRVILGLGAETEVLELEIRWPPPSTHIDRFQNLTANQYVTVVEGEGIKSDAGLQTGYRSRDSNPFYR